MDKKFQSCNHNWELFVSTYFLYVDDTPSFGGAEKSQVHLNLTSLIFKAMSGLHHQHVQKCYLSGK